MTVATVASPVRIAGAVGVSVLAVAAGPISVRAAQLQPPVDGLASEGLVIEADLIDLHIRDTAERRGSRP
jgi:hypothetical protein